MHWDANLANRWASTDEDYAYTCIREEFEDVVDADDDAGWLSSVAMCVGEGRAGTNRDRSQQ
jgi:hypothetical protein